MKKFNLIVLIFTLLISSQMLASDVKKKGIKKAIKKSQQKEEKKEEKKSPWSLFWYSSYAPTRDYVNPGPLSFTDEINTTQIFYTGYKFSDVDSISIESRFSAGDIINFPIKGTEITVPRLVAKYKRRKILDQKKDGINLGANAEFRLIPDKDVRFASKAKALLRFSVPVSWSFGKYTISGTNYLGYWVAPLETRAEFYLYFVYTETYSITDKISISLTEEFFEEKWIQDMPTAYRSGQPAVDSAMNLAPSLEIGYQITPKLGTSFSIGLPGFYLNDLNTLTAAYKNLENKLSYSIGVGYLIF